MEEKIKAYTESLRSSAEYNLMITHNPAEAVLSIMRGKVNPDMLPGLTAALFGSVDVSDALNRLANNMIATMPR
jgi:hypothetical protein